MAKDKPRLARLTAIITQLQSKSIVTAQDLANKHDVSIRTIYRDIRSLQQSGIPILAEEGKGYSILEGYYLPPVMFTQEEANALITAEQIIARNKDQSFSQQYSNAILKVKSLLKHSHQSQAELLTERIQVRLNYNNEKTSHHLIHLQLAITQYRLCQIQYLSLDDRYSEREIEPFALYTTQENWILIAFCLLKKDFRAFRLDRIQQLQVESQHFTPHDLTLEQYLEDCRQKWINDTDIPLSP